MITPKFIILILVFALVGHVASRAVNISTTWTLPQEGFPHFFRYFKEPTTWDDAKIICESFQAELLTVESDERRDAARAYLKEMDVMDNVWCGLQRASVESPFVWTGGGLNPLVGDGFWQEDNPMEPERLCVTINPVYDYRWQGIPCTGPQVYPFVCQMPVPDWAKGESGCLLISLPSLTVTYLPDIGIVELLSDCGLSGTRRIACKGQENQLDLMKRLSCERDEESSTSGWTDRTVHGTGNRWKTTTISDWVSGGTSRSWGTRHKRESGGTSTSTDTAIIQPEESTPEVVEVFERLEKISIDPETVPFDTSTQEINEIITDEPREPSEMDHSSQTDTRSDTPRTSETANIQSVSTLPTEIMPIKDSSDRSVEDIIITRNSKEMSPKNTAQVTSLYHQTDTPVTQEESIAESTKYSQEAIHEVNKEIRKSEAIKEAIASTTIPPSTYHTTSVATPLTIKEVSYQINPPLTLRSGSQSIKINSPDVIDLSAKPETLLEQMRQITEKPDAVKTDPVSTEVSHVDLSTGHSRNFKTTSIDIQAQSKIMTSTPHASLTNMDTWSDDLSLGDAAQGQDDKGENFKADLEEESDAETLTSNIVTDDPMNISNAEKKKEVVPECQKKTILEETIDNNPFNSATNIPVIVIDSLDDGEDSNAVGPQVYRIFSNPYPLDTEDPSPLQNATDSTTLDKNTLKYTTMKSLDEYQAKDIVTETTNKVVRVRQNVAVHETSRPAEEESDQDRSNQEKLSTSTHGTDLSNINHNDTVATRSTSDSSRSTNEPKDTIFETTTVTRGGNQSTTKKVENAQDFHGEEDTAEDVNQKRPSRGRFFPHSNPLSFYPYFLNRVLG